MPYVIENILAYEMSLSLKIVLSLSFFFLIIFNFIVVFNALFGPFLQKTKKIKSLNYKVSILIPARNEEKNLKKCVTSIMNQNYENFELIVLDDNSTDDTLKILKNLQKKFNFKVLQGLPLENGWLGKNYACKQLSEHSTGEILIFTDADNYISPYAIENTVSYIDRYNLSFFSAFPQQITKTFWEKLIIPVIDLLLFSFLPLWANYLSKNPAFAAANGQWIAVIKDDYLLIGGHKSVKNKVVEDVSLCREFKRKNLKVMTASGKGVVFGRMYSKFYEIWEGFSKNIFGLTDFNLIPFFLILSILLISSVFPYFMLFIHLKFAIILISLILLWRLILSLRYGHNPFISLFLHPVSIIIIILIGINSVIKYYKGGLNWKGRKIDLN